MGEGGGGRRWRLLVGSVDDCCDTWVLLCMGMAVYALGDGLAHRSTRQKQHCHWPEKDLRAEPSASAAACLASPRTILRRRTARRLWEPDCHLHTRLTRCAL